MRYSDCSHPTVVVILLLPPPKEILEAPPPKPALNVATWLTDKTDSPGEPKGVRIPQALMNLYYQHEVFGKEFRAFVDEWVAAFGAGTEDPHDQVQTCVCNQVEE